MVWKGKVGEDIRDLHAKYGPVVRTGPNTIDIADAKATDLILGIKHDFPKVCRSITTVLHIWDC